MIPISSRAEALAVLPLAERQAALRGFSKDQQQALLYSWRFWARKNQLPPLGDWLTWILRAGRGFGKTRSGAGWIQERAMAAKRWIALVARTPADARDFMIEGPAGFLRNAHPRERPLYEPSKRRLTWRNGSWATIFSDEEPDQARGYSGDTAWLDEVGKYKNPREVIENLDFGMREASDDRPRKIITTTPRPIPILMELEKRNTTVVTTGSSYDNRANLDPRWFESVVLVHEGTRLARQEIYAEYLTDAPGALWTHAMLEECRHNKLEPLPSFQRVVVGVDPSGASGDEDDQSSSIGIVVAAKGINGKAYVLEDATCLLSPAGWGRRVCHVYKTHEADKIVAEKNYGGAMVQHVIHTVDRNAPVHLVTATRGKAVRAEPVAALYEQGRVAHVGGFPELEDQLVLFTPNGYSGESSPDRADALVWALTELMLGGPQFSPGFGMAGPQVFRGGGRG